jgi:hypothetical protein
MSIYGRRSIWAWINPWGAWRRERATVQHYYHLWANAETANNRLRLQNDELDKSNARLTRKSMQRMLDLRKAQQLIASGHFRNPKTGRLGKRGETFSD